ncbi:uncharacterized protein N7482_005350 [Penicillium canariense]|uniref:C2H2-type domain-containing protein n=1 Tax=Penicillium canariense TaxID=189055 RepID=A0A9W9LM66_9EURO|nr:uncharacterized protein N7482_005350 [Penicillium canariense]KAJ5166569.1 hypothetical protein N7482_005350 [Penicillium canariense]
MEDSQLNWSDPADVLQGIMVDGSYPHPELADFKSSGLALEAPNPLLELDLGSLEPHHQPAFLGPWPPSSSEPHDFYPSYYPASRLTADQDAWNPLQVTGVPHPSSMSHMNMAVGDRDGFAKHHYRTPSESGSQYMGSFHSADSGYGSTSCATHSVVPSSYSVDSMSSPQVDGKEQGLGEPLAMFDQAYVGPPMFTRDLDSALESVKCDHPACNWVGKCPSDKRKHEARHRKLFKCDEMNCPRKEGFGTINDLARHKKCVHNKEPERGPKMMYLCFGKNCPRPNKKWPRLDNFKQHLSRMHHEEDADALLKKSMDWYENLTGQPGQIAEDSASQDDPDPSNETQQDLVSPHEMDLDSTDSLGHPEDTGDFLPSGATTPKPTQYDHTQPEIPALGGLVSLARDGRDVATERGSIKPETCVADAADNLINAMTKVMNSRGHRSSNHSDEGIEIESDVTQLSPPQRQMLQKVLSVALERLSDKNTSTEPEPIDDKQDWFQCDICSKRTRLRCEMKKHQKRHERPYGCTFPHCAKSFGSKADWKRHESSQHLHIPSWLCTLHDGTKGTSCARIFYREETFAQHLGQDHRVSKARVKTAVHNSRLDLADQPHFWCGFCTRNVSLGNCGAAALDERFNHIDVEHFKKGERGEGLDAGDNAFPSGSAAAAPANVGCRSETGHGSERSYRKRKFSG